METKIPTSQRVASIPPLYLNHIDSKLLLFDFDLSIEVASISADILQMSFEITDTHPKTVLESDKNNSTALQTLAMKPEIFPSRKRLEWMLLQPQCSSISQGAGHLSHMIMVMNTRNLPLEERSSIIYSEEKQDKYHHQKVNGSNTITRGSIACSPSVMDHHHHL
ncbi:hypothetical protein Ccrd_015834 [Cynara cardunculus var. scolymus]|uniref:Uncharacterized protein n=1 Tax=Cynara cardunculus var. scolymus TaxID=59895 RepID=A0A103YB08_CYNCS|nr:hypothetical protein Ccrd_015834 [Cynara cardunculus var. scolymus]